MKRSKWLERAVIYAATAVSMGLLLAGCALPATGPANGCVGPAGYCNPYFGS